MLRIVVVSQRGEAPARFLSAEFAGSLGSIGRDSGNTLVLPDPDKLISRVQAQVKCLGGEYFLIDNGGNPTLVNGRPLGKGRVAPLHHTDRIEMGDWVLQVQTGEADALTEIPGTQEQLAPAHAVTVRVPARDTAKPASPEIPAPAWGRESVFLMDALEASMIEDIEALTSEVMLQPEKAPVRRRQTRTQAPVARVADAESSWVQAFARGLGVRVEDLCGHTGTELAEHIGHLLREAMQGVIDLQMVREATRRGMKAGTTQIEGRRDNPFKSSKNVDAALQKLFSAPKGPKSMQPVEAIREAFDSMHSHQLASAVAMRLALFGALGTFKPEALEKRLSSANDQHDPESAAFKAKMWDRYGRYHSKLQAKAELNFQSVFVREFLRAYEEQHERLAREREA